MAPANIKAGDELVVVSDRFPYTVPNPDRRDRPGYITLERGAKVTIAKQGEEGLTVAQAQRGLDLKALRRVGDDQAAAAATTPAVAPPAPTPADASTATSPPQTTTAAPVTPTTVVTPSPEAGAAPTTAAAAGDGTETAITEALQGSVEQVAAYVGEHPDALNAVYDAELAKGAKARKGVLELNPDHDHDAFKAALAS